jgi:hypothetical protein
MPEPEVKATASKLVYFSSLFFYYTLIFPALLTVASHNLHGFKNSSSYHKSCLESHGGILMAQELWLAEKQLPIMKCLATQFVA